jgi:5-methyltetrahydropteroyltriglutamate--homocysteine methyltransferase
MKPYITYVGSFPLDYSKENFERVVVDVVSIGVNYPALPKLKEFVRMFMDPLIEAGVVKAVSGGYVVSDADRFSSVKPYIQEYVWAMDLIKNRFKDKIYGVRAAVTGPFTLASQIYRSEKTSLSNSVLADREFIRRLTDYVASAVKAVKDLGVTLIELTEPILSVIVGATLIMFKYTGDEIIDVLSRVFKVKCLNAIHVCGPISPKLASILLNSEVKILDHEHSDIPRNFEVYSRKLLEEHDKFIAVGVVSSKNPKVEDINDVKNLVKKSITTYGDRIFAFKPDCGFAGLKGFFKSNEEAYKVSIEKLKLIVQAVKESKTYESSNL